jgi:tRNA A-37 threonylcarbamoyl transferase component Bud32
MSRQMKTLNRYGKKWSTNEGLALQREYELLELTVQDIAVIHKRSVKAIVYKLEQEELIYDKNFARGYQNITETREEVTQILDSIARRVKNNHKNTKPCSKFLLSL